MLDNSNAVGFPARLTPGVYRVVIRTSELEFGSEAASRTERSSEQIRVVVHFENGRYATATLPDPQDATRWTGTLGMINTPAPLIGIEIEYLDLTGLAGKTLRARSVSLHRVLEVPWTAPLAATPKGTNARQVKF